MTNKDKVQEMAKEIYMNAIMGTQNLGVSMNEIERNYSGCGVDIYECPQCNKKFQVSYKVYEITEIGN